MIISSPLYQKKIHNIKIIYNTLKINKFSKNQINTFKQKKRLKKYDIIIFFGALNINDPRKGYYDLIDCLYEKNFNTIEDKKILIITVGNGKPINLSHKKIRHRHIDFITNSEEFYLTISSCDIFLNLTKSDYAPILCEIAFIKNLFILSSNMGIAKELIANGVNGYIFYNKKDMIQKFIKLIKLCSQKKNINTNNDKINYFKNNLTKNKSLVFDRLFNA